MHKLMDTLTDIKPLIPAYAPRQRGQSRLYILVITLLVVLLFMATPGLWTGGAFSEALFFSGLKTPAYGEFPRLTQKLFGLLAALGGYGSLWPLRLFSAFCAWLILLCTYCSARCLYGANAAFLAVLVLLTIPFFERFAVMGLPYMWLAALISIMLAMGLTAKNGRPWAWWRWALIWFISLLALLCCGLAALGALLPLLLCHFLILKPKKQLLFKLRMLLPLAVFAITLAALLCEGLLHGPEAWFSLEHTAFNISALGDCTRLGFWQGLGFALMDALGLWVLAFVLIALWTLKQLLRQQPAASLPCGKLLGVWLIAALLSSLCGPYDNSGRFLGLLPPLAILIGYYLDRYARYRNSLPQARHALKANAVTLKFLLTLWGIAICGVGVWLVFNLEQAWQREFFLETRHLVFLIVLGACLIVLSVRSFWIIGRAYAYWGFIVAMLLSFSFIGYGVVIPSRDILYTPYYFNQNLKTLFPTVKADGITVGVLPQIDRNVMRARFFLYADYPVHFVTLNLANFSDLAPALPSSLVLTSDILANLGAAPYEAGYRPVFWEEVAGTLLIVMKRFAETEPENALSLLNLANSKEPALWPSGGYCFTGGYLIPYNSQSPGLVSATQIAVYPDYNLRIFNAAVNEGLRDPYVFRWLVTAGRAAPKGAYTGLALNFKTPYVNKHWPYGVRFQQWALDAVMAEVQPAFTVFSGLNPEHGRTRRVLTKLLRPEKIRHIKINAPADQIDFERTTGAAFLKFYMGATFSLALELPLLK